VDPAKKVGFEPTNLSRFETMRVLFVRSFVVVSGFEIRICLLRPIRIHSMHIAYYN
jgi:hypothetical protein